MGTKIAINGLGRIGRAILKLVIEDPSLELVAVNDLADADNLAYLLRFDVDGYELTVFPDGRAIVKGTTDPAVARSVYARYIGM